MTAQIPAWDGDRLIAADKIDVHRRGLKHPAVSVFVRHGGEQLLQLRAAGKYHTPGLWANSCCTHPHWGESAADCAIRRLNEELGIRPGALRHAGKIEYRADVGGGMVEHELVDIFVAEPGRRPIANPDPQEVAATRWLTNAALVREIAASPQSFTPWLRIYMAKHADVIFGAG